MVDWKDYPPDYRRREVQSILQAACAGESTAVIGLSGSGKSNLLGFLEKGAPAPENCPPLVLVDCNRLSKPGPESFYGLIVDCLKGRFELPSRDTALSNLEALGKSLEALFSNRGKLGLLIDRFELITSLPDFEMVSNNLRFLRDRYKYKLTYTIATRKLIEPTHELAELFYGNTIWLGPLSRSDAMWSVRKDAARMARSGQRLAEPTLIRLVEISWGYPSLLKATVEACAAGTPAEARALSEHPAVERRIMEFWADEPDPAALLNSRLEGHPWLGKKPESMRVANNETKKKFGFDSAKLTAKENLLLGYFMEHPDEVCEKDALIRAVWPEDVIYERGIRDESLAQLIRRLRLKIETDPGDPRHIQTIPGRGYLFRGND